MTAFHDLTAIVYREREALRKDNPDIQRLHHRTRTMLQISAFYNEREHLGWEEWRLTKRELERISRNYSERFPHHEDFKFVLVTTAACVKEADARRVDVTSLIDKINLGE